MTRIPIFWYFFVLFIWSSIFSSTCEATVDLFLGMGESPSTSFFFGTTNCLGYPGTGVKMAKRGESIVGIWLTFVSQLFEKPWWYMVIHFPMFGHLLTVFRRQVWCPACSQVAWYHISRDPPPQEMTWGILGRPILPHKWWIFHCQGRFTRGYMVGLFL